LVVGEMAKQEEDLDDIGPEDSSDDDDVDDEDVDDLGSSADEDLASDDADTFVLTPDDGIQMMRLQPGTGSVPLASWIVNGKEVLVWFDFFRYV
jgi:hypothetical protein